MSTQETAVETGYTDLRVQKVDIVIDYLALIVMEGPVEKLNFTNYWRCLDDAVLGNQNTDVVASYTLVKLASRCNISCTYCYWFRDATVYHRASVLTKKAEGAFIKRLRAHINRFKLTNYSLLFHGGEPLLFGKERFHNFCSKLRALEEELCFELRLAITTNGLLIDDTWALIFRAHKVGVTLSIDGPREVHDLARLDFRGMGTFDRVVDALSLLRRFGLEPGALSVCNPASDPIEVCQFFVEELEFSDFDILVPDATHEDSPASIAGFYIGLFDVWYDRYMDRGVRIRFLETLINGVLGGESKVESIGYGPNTTVTLLTDGALEPLDVLRTVGDGFTRTNINVFDNELQDIQTDPLWREVLKSSLELSADCKKCRYYNACGGGHIGSRWSNERRFDNPSVYCADFMEILDHVWTRVAPDVHVSRRDHSDRSILEVLATIGHSSYVVEKARLTL